MVFALIFCLLHLSNALDFGYETIEKGECLSKIETDDRITILYKAFDQSGNEIENRYDLKRPFTYRVGFAEPGDMEQLWNEGVVGLCQGEVAEIEVTTDERDTPRYPVETELKYIVSVVEIVKSEKPRKPPLTIENFKLMDLDKNGILLRSELFEYTKSLHVLQDEKIIDRMVQHFFNLYDKDHNNEIPMNEFSTVHSEL
eukprot:m.101557 g.101557  ORF g.101557 m.101557 type:complete len:200 (+) comp37133_c1_seq7:44-643(+)